MTQLRAWLDAFPWGEPLLVLAGSVLAAFLVDVLLRSFLPSLTRRTRTDLDDRILALVRRPLALSFVLAGLALVVLRLQPASVWADLTLGAIRTLAILLWLGCGIRVSRLILDALSRNHERFALVQPRTLPLLDNVTSVVLLGGALYLLLVTWKLDVSGWVASAGILGLAVGLAAKDTLANLFAGLALLADAPFELGDYVVLDTGERGEVTRVGIRTSRIRTRDDIEIIVPNSILADSKIVNEAGGPGRQHRIRASVDVAYDSDLDEVDATLMEIARENPDLLPEPTPRVRVREFGDSGIRVELMGWIPEPFQRGRVLDALLRAIHRRFGERGIEIPYPKRDLYLHHVGED